MLISIPILLKIIIFISLTGRLFKTCDEALKYGFASVAVFPICIGYVAKRLKSSPVNSQVAVGFPFGNHFTRVPIPSVLSRNYLIRDEVKVNLTYYNK